MTQILPPSVLLHLFTAIPALLLGAFILSRRMGTFVHKLTGRLWVALMLVTAVSSFGIKSAGQFSWLHILSVVTVVSIVMALVAIRRGKRERHRRFMQGAYTGLAIAFVFTLVPGRLVGGWFRQLIA